MRIVVDVMGGDHDCGVVIEGVKLGLQRSKEITSLILVGDEAEIQRALSARKLGDSRLRIIHAPEVLTMEDKPTDVLRRKKDCSMARALDVVVLAPGEERWIQVDERRALRALRQRSESEQVIAAHKARPGVARMQGLERNARQRRSRTFPGPFEAHSVTRVRHCAEIVARAADAWPSSGMLSPCTS